MTMYRAEIMELDAALGRLIKALEERDPGLQNTALLLLSDHGHCFGEGGWNNVHAGSLMEATQHIPALLHLPGGTQAGRHVSETVYQVDIAATLAGLAGFEALDDQQGINLLPAIQGHPLPAREWFAEGILLEAWQEQLSHIRHEDGSRDERLIGIRTSTWKLFYRNGAPDEGRLFRLDHGQELEVPEDSEPQVAEMLRQLLASMLATLPTPIDAQREMGVQERAGLQALGYIDGDS